MQTMEHLQEVADSLTLKELRDVRDEAGDMRTGFPYPLHSPSPLFYVKFGNQDACLTRMEAVTQTFAYNALQALSQSATDTASVPRVPKVLRVMEGYTVMEYVEGTTFLKLSETKSWEEQLEYIDRIAKAIDILLTIPIPADASPGPYKGGLIRHPLFKDADAPKVFKDVASLQEHINYMSTMPQKSRYTADPPRPECSFDTRLYLVYSDFYPGNFIFDASGTLWIIDFGHANFLPLDFQTFALHKPFVPSLKQAFAVRKRMKTELPTNNMEALIRARGWFVMSVAGIGIPKAEQFCGDSSEYIPVADVGRQSRPDAPRGTSQDMCHSWLGKKDTCIPLLLAGGALVLGVAWRYLSGRRT